MKVTKNSVVFLRYKLSNEQGDVLEDALDQAPVAVLQGHGNIIAGLDRALLDHQAGDVFEVAVPPEQGYGLRQDNQIQRVSKKYFSQPRRLVPGAQVSLQTDQGARLVTVVKVGAKVVDVDTNHPLAGQTLHFHVEIDEVREASPTELAHRHAHADGHDHH